MTKDGRREDRMDALIQALEALTARIGGVSGGQGGGSGGGAAPAGGNAGGGAGASPVDMSGDFGVAPGGIDGAATTSGTSSRGAWDFYRQGQSLAGSAGQYAAEAARIAGGMSGGFSAAMEAISDVGISTRSVGMGVLGGIRASEKVVSAWSSEQAEAYSHTGDTSEMQKMRRPYAERRARISAEESRDSYSGLDAIESVFNPDEFARRHSDFAARRTAATQAEQNMLAPREATNEQAERILGGLARAGGFDDKNPAQAANIRMSNNIMGMLQDFNVHQQQLTHLIQAGTIHADKPGVQGALSKSN